MANMRVNFVNHGEYWAVHLWEVSGGPRPKTTRSLGFVNVRVEDARSPAALLHSAARALEMPLLARYQPPAGGGIGAP